LMPALFSVNNRTFYCVVAWVGAPSIARAAVRLVSYPQCVKPLGVPA
jgi:hypothetical protein